MTQELRTQNLSPETLEAVILNGDLSKLNPKQKVEYIVSLCNRVGLDPSTQPFKLMTLNGKQIAYADRSCAAQLNKLHSLSHQITDTQKDADWIMMVDRCTGPDGRYTEEVGAVSLTGLKGENLCNAVMKCRTKAMRRATLTHVGLGLLDETEVDTIRGAQVVPLATTVEDAKEWTEADLQEAKDIVNAFGDFLDGMSVENAEIETILAKPRSTIGDERGLDNWKNRFDAFSKRTLDSLEKKKVVNA